jgi:hypothetical protein
MLPVSDNKLILPPLTTPSARMFVLPDLEMLPTAAIAMESAVFVFSDTTFPV